MEPDTMQLAEKAGRGNRAAGVQLVECFYQRIYAFLRRLSGNETDAADLTQRTFGRVWQALPSFAGRASVSSWMHSIAYHVYVDWRRSDRRLELQSDQWWAERAADEPGPDQHVSRSDLSRAVYRSVDELGPELRDTVHLHYFQELTLDETAEALGVATSTVKYRLRQALNHLQTKLAGERTAPDVPGNLAQRL